MARRFLNRVRWFDSGRGHSKGLLRFRRVQRACDLRRVGDLRVEAASSEVFRSCFLTPSREVRGNRLNSPSSYGRRDFRRFQL